MIEQVLMRSVKMSYGLTQGKRLSETQQLVWLMSTTPCRHVLQQRCICIYVTTIRTNQSDDILTFLITAIKLVNSIMTPYTLDLIDYLSQRDPFSQDHVMQCVNNNNNNNNYDIYIAPYTLAALWRFTIVQLNFL